jgi:hypothetical protein
MQHLTDFIKYMNNDVGGNGPLPNLLHGDYGTAIGQSLERHFVEDRQRGGVRMSNVGKPATLLALAKLGYSEPEPRGKLRFIFHLGDIFENFLEVMLQSYGIEILESQSECSYTSSSGITMDGHLDYIIKSPVTGVPVVVEAKTMSAGYSRTFRKYPDDNRGYVSQLSLYAESKGLDATWVCMDKGDSSLFEVPLDYDTIEPSLQRVEKVLERVAQVDSISDVLKVFRAPPDLKAEVYQKQPTGKYFVPAALKWSPFRHALYKISVEYNNYGKETEYVEDFADTAYMKDMLDKLVETGEIAYAPNTL